MGLFTLLFRLPLMPLRGFVRLAVILHDQAERDLRDPASVRRQLEGAQEARVSGELSDQDLARVESLAVGRLLSFPQSGPASTASRKTASHRTAARTKSPRRTAARSKRS
jgi:Gas vesicle protein G